MTTNNEHPAAGLNDLPLRSPEEILEEARKLIGTESEMSYGPYPVEYDPIRRYLDMTDDRNPLHLDPVHASETQYGGVICPPLLTAYFAGQGTVPLASQSGQGAPGTRESIPTPGKRGVNLTVDWEFYQPVRIGDRLSSKTRIADVYIKPIRVDPKAFWTVMERLIYNQNGELVAKGTNLGIRHRTESQVAADQVPTEAAKKVTDNE